MVPEQLEGRDAELVARLNTACRKVMVIGRSVFVPPIYSSHRPYVFKIKELRLMYQLTQTEDFKEACKKAEISETLARRFLKSSTYLAFAAEAINDQAIHDGWTPRRIVLELDAIYRGEKVKSDPQMDALKELRSIIMPKKSEGIGGGVTVNLNFPVLSPDAQAKLKEIADREASIDVEAA